MSKTTGYKCPACGKRLQIGVDEDEFIWVHCPHGPCNSMVADAGAPGRTVAEAVELLTEMVNDEMGRNEA